MRKRAMVIGAGAIGRGLTAPLLHKAGYEVVFLDANRDLVQRLKSRDRYTVRLSDVAGRTRDVAVEYRAAFGVEDEEALRAEISCASIVITAVGAERLPAVAVPLAKGLAQRAHDGIDEPLNILACENMRCSSTVLREHVRRHLKPSLHEWFEKSIGFPDSMVSRIVPDPALCRLPEDELSFLAEDYVEWTADRHGFVGDLPNIPGLSIVADQATRLERKLYVHNGGHAICGYLGWLKGHRLMHEAIADEWIRLHTRTACIETSHAVALEHGLPQEETAAYVDILIPRIANRHVPDTVARVIREPLRKLGPGERFAGPLMLCIKHGIKPESLAAGTAGALLFDDPADEQAEELSRLLSEIGVAGVLNRICGLTERNAMLTQRITREYERLRVQKTKWRNEDR